MPRHHSENGWNKATVELMLSLKASASILAYKYEKASEWYYTAHNVISIPMIIIMSIVGSATFTTLSDDCSANMVWKVIAGSITILAAIMTAVNNFLDFRGKSVLCRSSYTGFKTLENEILRMLLLKPSARVPYNQFSQDMFNLYNKLYTDAPTLVSYFKKLEQKDDEGKAKSTLDMDGYCIFVQNKRNSFGLGGGLSYDGSKITKQDRVNAVNTQFSTVGLDSLGGRELRNMVSAAAYSSSDGSHDIEGGVEVKIEE